MEPQQTSSELSSADIRQELENVQSMNIVFGGAIIILAVIVTGIVCVLGGVRVPFLTTYFVTVPVSVQSAK